jgi:hypothetical protein
VQDTSPDQANASQPGDGAARSLPWPPGSATGVGSMPGTDPEQACAVVLGELPDLPYLPELPGRGVGADIIGRTAALLVDLPVETTPHGWKFATHPGRDQRRAAGFLSFDLDALQQAADGYTGPLKIAVCGPLSLAAQIELSRTQNPALADPGALADLTASLAEGLAAHVAQVRQRVPGATVLVQLDEPALPAVLAGHVPTASGLNVVPALDETVASATLRSVLEATTAFSLVHCCAPRVPLLFLRDAGAAGVSFDLSLLPRPAEDAVAELAESGLGVFVGAVPTTRNGTARPVPPRDTAQDVVTLWRRMTLDPRRLAEQVVITPACGLAGLSPQDARDKLAHCREAAHIMPEMIEEGASS